MVFSPYGISLQAGDYTVRLFYSNIEESKKPYKAEFVSDMERLRKRADDWYKHLWSREPVSRGKSNPREGIDYKIIRNTPITDKYDLPLNYSGKLI